MAGTKKDQGSDVMLRSVNFNQVITWLLNVLVAGLLAMGASAFNDVKSEVKGMKGEMSSTNMAMATMNTSVEVLRANQSTSSSAMTAFQATMTNVSTSIQNLSTAVEVLKGVGNILSDLRDSDREQKQQILRLEDRIRLLETENAKDRSERPRP